MKYYLAVDIGASSGRHILAHIDDGKLILEEIYRFDNGMEMKDGELCWDVNKLTDDIINGMKHCKEIGKIPQSIGIDTWGVDFVLLDENDEIIGNTVGYRDDRTKDMDNEVYKIISEEKLYERTGIQKQIYNTIYQLMALKTSNQDILSKAHNMLMMPDYFHYYLSGVKCTEYTIATTSQLVNAQTRQWDYDLIKKLSYPDKIFNDIKMPGDILGDLRPEIQEAVGYNCHVVLPPAHDTASAVLAVPLAAPDTVYISSGTWSLMGIERDTADCSKKSRTHNFTNEGGYKYRFRYLKNIMGLWMIQSVKKEIGQGKSYDEICKAASMESIESIVECNDGRFLSPHSMTEEIKAYCKETGQEVPDTLYKTAAVIYNSLAVCYKKTIEELEDITGRKFTSINVVGGGSNADYLNGLIAEFTKRKVYAGPSEATAAGNLVVQMITDGYFMDVDEARRCIKESFSILEY